MSEIYSAKTLRPDGVPISPVTMSSTVVLNEAGDTLDNLLGTALPHVAPRAVNRFFTLMIDDPTTDLLTKLPLLRELGIRPAVALRMDYIPDNIRWNDIIRLRNAGCEIAYHGTLHADTGLTTDGIGQDIVDFMAIAEEHHLRINGYIGPNGYALPEASRHKFLWARSSGLTAYGDGGETPETYASLNTIWLDDCTEELATTVIGYIDTLGDGMYVNFSIHAHKIATNEEYLRQIIGAYRDAGFVCMTPTEAVAHTLAAYGGMARGASTLNIQAGTETHDYFLVSATGKVRTNQLPANGG